MRALACVAVLLGGCALPLTRTLSLHVGGEGQLSHRANAARPRSYVGLRLYLSRHP